MGQNVKDPSIRWVHGSLHAPIKIGLLKRVSKPNFRLGQNGSGIISSLRWGKYLSRSLAIPLL